MGLGEHPGTPKEDTGQLNLHVPSLLGHARRELEGPLGLHTFMNPIIRIGVGGWELEFDLIGWASVIAVETTMNSLAQLQVTNNWMAP